MIGFLREFLKRCSLPKMTAKPVSVFDPENKTIQMTVIVEGDVSLLHGDLTKYDSISLNDRVGKLFVVRSRIPICRNDADGSMIFSTGPFVCLSTIMYNWDLYENGARPTTDVRGSYCFMLDCNTCEVCFVDIGYFADGILIDVNVKGVDLTMKV